MKCLILLLVLALCTTGQPVLRQCPASLQCRVAEQCPAQHTSLEASLESRVCDSQQGKVCCLTGSEISGSIGPTKPHEYPFMVQLNIQVNGTNKSFHNFIFSAFQYFSNSAA